MYVVPRLFSEKDLMTFLDPRDETEEEYHEEQRQRRPSFDSADIDAGLSEFRPEGVAPLN